MKKIILILLIFNNLNSAISRHTAILGSLLTSGLYGIGRYTFTQLTNQHPTFDSWHNKETEKISRLPNMFIVGGISYLILRRKTPAVMLNKIKNSLQEFKKDKVINTIKNSSLDQLLKEADIIFIKEKNTRLALFNDLKAKFSDIEKLKDKLSDLENSQSKIPIDIKALNSYRKNINELNTLLTKTIIELKKRGLKDKEDDDDGSSSGIISSSGSVAVMAAGGLI